MPLYGHGKSGYVRDLHATKGQAASKGITCNGYLSDAKDVKLMALRRKAQKVDSLASIKISEADLTSALRCRRTVSVCVFSASKARTLRLLCAHLSAYGRMPEGAKRNARLTSGRAFGA
jgi:hypothetical protein